MIELKYESIEELNLAYSDKFKELAERSLKTGKEDKDKFADGLMLEYNFYLKQIKSKMELDEKFSKLNLKLLEKSEIIKFNFNKRKQKYTNKQQKKLNKELYKTFKKECMLGIKKNVSDEKLFYDLEFKKFNEEQEILKKSKSKKNKSDFKALETSKESDTKLLEQRRDDDAGTKDDKAT